MPVDRWYRDTETLGSLPRISQSGQVKAYLSWNENGNLRSWVFLYPIQQLEISMAINYGLNDTIATNSKSLYWKGNDPKTINLPGLILDTYWDGRSVRPILEGVEKLAQASAERRSPPVLSFVCGNVRLTPCVLTDRISYTIGRMVGGEPVTATLNLTLTQVSTGQLIAPAALPIPVGTPVILIPQITVPVVVTPTPSPSPSGGTGTGGSTAPVFTGDVAKGVYYFGGCTSWGIYQDGNDGIIATAGHCIPASKTVTIDGKEYKYTTIGQDGNGDKTDVAVVRVKDVKINVLKVRTSTADLKKGEAVYSIGYPGGDPTQETTTGTIVSNPIAEGESKYHDGTPGAYIRYSARFLHPGNSGGPQFLKSTNEVISTTHGGAQNTNKNRVQTADQFQYPESDNFPTGSKSENTLALLKKAGITIG